MLTCTIRALITCQFRRLVATLLTRKIIGHEIVRVKTWRSVEKLLIRRVTGHEVGPDWGVTGGEGGRTNECVSSRDRLNHTTTHHGVGVGGRDSRGKIMCLGDGLGRIDHILIRAKHDVVGGRCWNIRENLQLQSKTVGIGFAPMALRPTPTIVFRTFTKPAVTPPARAGLIVGRLVIGLVHNRTKQLCVLTGDHR